MLREWLTYLTTPCSPDARRLGYLREAVSLLSRRERCRAAWAPHELACQDVVRDAMAGLSGRAVVLGSGLLTEIPLAEMAAAFDEVVLVDMVHLAAARKRARGLSNVRFVGADVTGLLHRVEPGEPLPTPQPHLPDTVQGADFVVSIGLLSQLALLPLEAVGGEDAVFAAALVRAHLDALSALTAPVCLISEDARETVRDGAVTRQDALWGVALPPLDRDWIWDIAPAPELGRDTDIRCRVRGGVL